MGIPPWTHDHVFEATSFGPVNLQDSSGCRVADPQMATVKLNFEANNL